VLDDLLLLAAERGVPEHPAQDVRRRVGSSGKHHAAILRFAADITPPYAPVSALFELGPGQNRCRK
jgi:hypothetical protein